MGIKKILFNNLSSKKINFLRRIHVDIIDAIKKNSDPEKIVKKCLESIWDMNLI